MKNFSYDMYPASRPEKMTLDPTMAKQWQFNEGTAVSSAVSEHDISVLLESGELKRKHSVRFPLLCD